MKFYDSHSHCIKVQSGGILIGLEGSKKLEGFMNNDDVFQTTSQNPAFMACYYILRERNEVPDETFLKYHPRRERYTVDEVIADLKTRKCKVCIIDTLNEPYWDFKDYWNVVLAFPKIKFILPHMGGYDIANFVKILDFNKNVFCDFSMTQEFFGWCGERTRYPLMADAIDYCLTSKKLNKRVMFGSDEPDFSQAIALEKYMQLPNADDILIKNYESLLNSI